MVDSVGRFVFVPGKDQFRVHAAGHALDVDGPAVRRQNVHVVGEAAIADPVEVGQVAVAGGLITGGMTVKDSGVMTRWLLLMGALPWCPG